MCFTTEIRYQGDASLLLDLPPSICLLLLTLQGLHALLAEEGPLAVSCLISKFKDKWAVPLKYQTKEYGLQHNSPVHWNDSLTDFLDLFPEVLTVGQHQPVKAGEAAPAGGALRGPSWGPQGKDDEGRGLGGSSGVIPSLSQEGEEGQGLTVSCVDPPQFRAVANRMRQLMAGCLAS